MKFIALAFAAMLAAMPSSCEKNLTKGLEEEKSYSRVAMEKYRKDPKVFRGFPGVLENWSRMDYVALTIAQQNISPNWANTTETLNFLQPKIRSDTTGKPFCVIQGTDEIVVLRVLSQSVNCSTELAASLNTKRIRSGDMEFSGRTDYWVYVHRPPRLLQELVRSQHDVHSAIAWVDANKLEFIVFSNKPTMRSYPLPGPALWAASIYGPTDEVFGGLGPSENSTLAAVQDGRVLWTSPDLIIQQPPEVSPNGQLLLLKGKDRKTNTEGLLLVRNQGQKVTSISRVGKDPSWSSDDMRFAYEEKGKIVVYDLRSNQGHAIAPGNFPTWSPDGKWLIYRTPKNQFVLADANGTVQRTLLEGKRVLTSLHWSPDSQYLMYVKQSTAGCNHVEVYRMRDGESASVYEICEGYPFWMLQWVRLPSNVTLD